MKSIGLSHTENNNACLNINTSDALSSLDGDRITIDPYEFVQRRVISMFSDLGTGVGVDDTIGMTGTPNDSNSNSNSNSSSDSNYSYTFATLLGMKRLSYVRRLICNKLDGRRYSQPDIGAMDTQRLQNKFMTRQQSPTSKLKQKSRHQHYDTLSTGHNHTGGSFGNGGLNKSNSHSNNNNDFDDIILSNHCSKNTYSSLPASPIFWDYEPDHGSSSPEENDNDLQQQKQHTNTIIDPLSHQTITTTSPTLHHYRHKDQISAPKCLGKTSSGDLKTLLDSNGNLDNIATLEPNHNAPRPSRYLRVLHTPTGFLPQQQGILGTDYDGNLLLFNDIACHCLVIDKSYIGRSIFSKFDSPAQCMVPHLVCERKKQLRRKPILLQRHQLSVDQSSMVLMCGVIIPIIKTNGQKSAASFWLKEKWNQDQGRFVYIWIFEEISENRLTLTIDNKDMIQNTTLSTIEDFYGYGVWKVIGQPIKNISTSLDIEPNITYDLVNKNRFCCSRSKNGKHSPSIVQLQENKLQITSLPTISGLTMVHQSGMIQNMKPVPVKYLFGYKGVMEAMHIDKLQSQFMTLVALLNQQHLLRPDRMVTFEDCMDIFCHSSQNILVPTTTSIIFVHPDGSNLDVKLEIRWVESSDENVYSVWITYNRISSLALLLSPSNTDDDMTNKISQTNLSTNQSSLKQHSTLSASSTTYSSNIIPTNITNLETTNTNTIDPETTNINTTNPEATNTNTPDPRTMDTDTPDPETTIGRKDTDFNPNCGRQQQNYIDHQHQQQRRASKSTFSRFERFGSVPNEKSLFPGMHSNSSSGQSIVGPSSILFPELDDYMVIDSLGEGTYGSVKLVYLKSDPSQEFVIKAIMKSRIIVDSWIRDRKHGTIPMEVHILLKLQQHLHVNCPQLVTFFEDDENYYTVTKLHGDGMDLFDYIELNDEMTEGQVRCIFYQVAAAVQHLHHLRIVHRDIKDENILLNEHGIVQLIDFGSAAYYREGRLFDTFGGTLDHSSPEVLNGTPYAGPPQDMWSLGILLYTLIYRETPFYSVDDIMQRNMQLPYIPYPEIGGGPVDLLRKLLDRDINKRPTIDQVMQDPWLQNCA